MAPVSAEHDSSSGSLAGALDPNVLGNDPIRGVLWTTQRHGGRDASLSMVAVQSEPHNWMLDGAGSEFDEDAAERPLSGAPPPPPPSSSSAVKKPKGGTTASPTVPGSGGGALASLFGSNTLSRTRRAPRRTVSTDSAVSLDSVESFWSYGSNDGPLPNNSTYNLNHHKGDGDRDDEEPVPRSITTQTSSSSTADGPSVPPAKESAPPSAVSPTGRRGGKRRDFQLRVLSSQGATLVTNRGDENGEEDQEDSGDRNQVEEDTNNNNNNNNNVDNDGAPILRRIFRTFSWDGYDPNRGATNNGTNPQGAVGALPSTKNIASAPASSTDHQAWMDEKERMTGEVEALRKQAIEVQALAAKYEMNPQLVKTLEQQLQSAAEEHVQVSDLVKELQRQIQAKDQELTVLRLESLTRGGFGSGHAGPSGGGASGGADSIGLCTSSRWDSPEVRGGSAAVLASAREVSADEYKALQAARDTAMMRAGELAHQLALARGDVDDLQERLHLTTERLQTTILESVELKAQNDALQAKVEWLEHQQQQQQYQPDGRKVSGSASSSSAHGVPRTPSSRLGQLLQRSPAKSSSPSPFQRLQTLATAPSSPSPTVVTPTSDPSRSLEAEQETDASVVSSPAFATVSVDGPDSMSSENEVLAQELFKLKNQVSQLQDEKAECLATLVEAQTQLSRMQSQGSQSS